MIVLRDAGAGSHVNVGSSARSADSVRGCPRDRPSGCRRSRTYGGQRRRDECHPGAFTQVRAVCWGEEERSVKPSAQPTLVRTQHLPPPAKTAPWLRKRGPAGRFLLVTPCSSACHCGSMHGSVRVHMVYSVRAKLAVRITARFTELAAVTGGKDASQHAQARRTPGCGCAEAG